MGQKNTFFEKQSGEAAENKGSGSKNKPEQTGKQSGEVVENTCLWKKQTGNKPKTKLPILLKMLEDQKNEPEKKRPRYSLAISAPRLLHPEDGEFLLVSCCAHG